MVPSLEWTGQSLYDLANARVRSLCGADGKQPKLRDLFDDSIDEQRLIDAFRDAARAAAPVQVSVPPARGPLPAVCRDAAGVEDCAEYVRDAASVVPKGSSGGGSRVGGVGI